jgi:hypothetical protein
MENIFAQLQHLAEEVKEYVNVRIDLVKLNAAETASRMVATTMATIISVVIFLFFLFFLSTGVALLVSAAIGKTYSGFLIVGGFYLVLGIVIWYSRGKLIQVPVMNAIIRQLFSNNGKDQKN